MTRDQGSPPGRAALFKLEMRNEKGEMVVRRIKLEAPQSIDGDARRKAG